MIVSLPDRLARVTPLMRAFEDAGHAIHFVGGCVRDLLLDPTAPLPDIDLATSARPEASAEVLASMRLKPILIGARFGTVAVHYRGTLLEITTYRAKETYPSVGRHPEVIWGDDVVEDLKRRDLSINAMAMNADGTLIDPWAGQEALRARVLEVPGGGLAHTETIFRDDPLRILRVARFFARLGFVPTEATTEAAARTAPELTTISKERVRAELDKTWAATHVREAAAWLVTTGALRTVAPELHETTLGRLPEQLHVARQHGLGWAVLGRHMADAIEPSRAPEPSELDRAADLLQHEFRFSVADRRATRTWMDPWVTSARLAEEPTLESLRRWEDAAGEHAARQAWLWYALAPGDPWVRERVEVWTQALADAQAEHGPLAPSLPHKLGALLAASIPGLRGASLGEALRAVREAVLRGDLPNPPSVDACVEVARGVIEVN
jgi:tRNA nucleotidyltransferase/poly(A) polymerase